MKHLLLVLLTLFGLTGATRAQCQVIDPRFNTDGTDGRINVMKYVDLGSGPQLYVGGLFTRIGAVPARNIARWNGTAWEAFGQELNGEVMGLVDWNDGTGTKLYVAGWFLKAGALTVNGIARWDGSNWSALGTGTNGGLNTIGVHDEGSGPKLFIGGAFTSILSVPNCNNIARWNGTAWSAVGFGANAPVYGLASYDDGTGNALYVTGNMSSVGTSALNDTPINGIARWKSGAWSMPGTGVNSYTRGVAVLDDGSGPALFVGGGFTTAGGSPADRVAKWSPSGWSAVGFGLNSHALWFTMFDDGAGPRLYAGGVFTGGIVKLDAGQWYALAAPAAQVRCMIPFDDGSGTKLLVAGGLVSFNAAGLAQWNGTNWSRISPGLGTYGILDDLVVHDDGTGPALYATSRATITQAGDVAVGNTIRRTNGAWSTVGVGPRGYALESIPSGPLAGLYLVGRQGGLDPLTSNGVMKWDGTAWTMVGVLNYNEGENVWAAAYFDDGSGPALYVAGSINAIGHVNSHGCAKWDGTTWIPVPHNLGTIVDLAVYDDGSGAKLFGVINSPSPLVVKLTAGVWQALASTPPSASRRLAVYDDGFGPKLYCGGGATFVRWNGATWDNMNVPAAAALADMLVYDDGSGSALYLFGASVIKWTAAGAIDLGIPITNAPFSPYPWGTAVFDDGTGPAIYMGGEIKMVDRKFSDHIGSFRTCTTSESASFCFGDFVGANCPCPALAAPLSGQGCPNTTGQGALLGFGGVSSLSADTATLLGSGMPNGGALYFQGSTQIGGGNGMFFGDGKLCITGSIVRLGVKFNAGGASQYPVGGDLPISVQGLLGAPGVQHYQVWYRDASFTYCTVHTFNLSNGLTMVWGP